MEVLLKLKRGSFSTAMVLIAGFFLIVPGLPGRAQSAKDLNGFIGQWQINLSKTTLNRKGPNGKYTPRAATYTNIFSIRGKNLKMEVFNHYPQAAPSRSMAIITDEKEHICKPGCTEIGGPADDGTRVETHTYYKIDPHMVVRLTRVNGKMTEYLMFGLSADGKTMTQVIWSPGTPEWQTVYVYDKQQ